MTAVLMLLLFVEKSGLRLLLHTHCHQYAGALAKDNSGHSVVLQQGCDCVEDFFVPLTPGEEIRVIVPTLQHEDRHLDRDINLVCASPCLSSLLRGPPAFA
jgi:hypothetical protein